MCWQNCATLRAIATWPRPLPTQTDDGVDASPADPLQIDAAARRVLRPLDPFLIEGDSSEKYQGCIACIALDPLWAWVCRDLVPAETKTFRAEVGRLLAAGTAADCEHVVNAFQDRVVEAIRAASPPPSATIKRGGD